MNFSEIRKQRMEQMEQLRKKQCKGKTFKLVGIANPLKIFPGFVIPIFVCEQDGKHYAQEGDDDKQTLNSFYETENYDALENVTYLDHMNVNEFSDSLFTLDSDPVFAFQISETDYFIGYAADVKSYLNTYIAESIGLKKEIDSFMNCG